MKLNPVIMSAIIAAALGLQAWTLHEVVSLKVQLAEMNTKLILHVQDAKTPGLPLR